MGSKMKIDHMIHSKRIVIYGTGNTGKEFYNKFKNKLPIYACTSSEENPQSIENMKVISYREIDKGKDFLVICSVSYQQIKKKLLLDGYELYNDFCRSNIFEGLYSAQSQNKRIVIGVGQCEIREICETLSQINQFSQNFEVFYFDERKVCGHGDKFELTEYWECQPLLNMADYLLKPSVFNSDAVEGFGKLLQWLRQECQIINVSLFDFDSYWPQDIASRRELSKYYIVKPGTKINAFANRDQCIERFVDEKYSVKQIIDKIVSLDFFDKDIVIKNHLRSIKRAKLTDRTADIKVSEFIENQYNVCKLYCDRGHFNEVLLKEYVKEILVKLNHGKGIEELRDLSLNVMFQRINELPIYPCTAHILKLEWITEDTKYRMVAYDDIKLVTFNEYMERLIQYYIHAKQTLQNCYFGQID